MFWSFLINNFGIIYLLERGTLRSENFKKIVCILKKIVCILKKIVLHSEKNRLHSEKNRFAF